MPVYNIYVLDESDITLSSGVLDGVTQGDGSHLAGQTLTLNSASWQPISITDSDSNFEDNDGTQQLNGAQTIDGTIYASGTTLEAEYGFTVSDGVDTWTLVGFNVNNSSPSYGTVEGLAFIGGPGGFPPVGTPLTVTSTFEGPDFAAADYATPVCLVAGTLVQTRAGSVPIEQIEPGDLVMTRDNGWQPVRWTGARHVRAEGRFAPVRFAPGVLGNDNALMVSQQHRVLLEGWRAELICGTCQTLATAVHLINDDTVRLMPGGTVCYVHLLFDSHEVIRTNGCWTESLYPGDETLKALLPAARAEVLALFPELEPVNAEAEYGALAHPQATRREAMLLAQAGFETQLHS